MKSLIAVFVTLILGAIVVLAVVQYKQFQYFEQAAVGARIDTLGMALKQARAIAAKNADATITKDLDLGEEYLNRAISCYRDGYYGAARSWINPGMNCVDHALTDAAKKDSP